MKILLYRLGFLVLLLAAWTIASWLIPRNLIPTPAATLAAAQRLFSEARIWVAIGDSLMVYGLGFALAAAVAIPIGVLMGSLRPLGKTLDVYVNALAATPRVAFVPLIIVLLGLGVEAKVLEQPAPVGRPGRPPSQPPKAGLPQGAEVLGRAPLVPPAGAGGQEEAQELGGHPCKLLLPLQPPQGGRYDFKVPGSALADASPGRSVVPPNLLSEMVACGAWR